MTLSPIPVAATAFVHAFEDHWTTTLKNTASPKFRDLWYAMGTAYEKAILATANGDPSRWRVLETPTGSGKTVGACLYAAMTAAENAKITDPVFGDRTPIGVLIVVRLKQQAETVAADINTLATQLGLDGPVAHYHHSGLELSDEDKRKAQVLVVCHQAYVNAVAGRGVIKNYNTLLEWEPEGAMPFPRYLTIIDESLSNVVNTSEVTYQHVHAALQVLAPGSKIANAYPREVAALETVRDIFKAMNAQHQNARQLLEKVRGIPEDVTFSDLWNDLRKLPLKAWNFPGSYRDDDKLRIKQQFAKNFEALNVLVRQWHYYAKSNKAASLHTSSFLIPDDSVSPVCLDATASNNFLWRLLGEDRAQPWPTPTGVRNYQNVAAHCAVVKDGLGKTAMRGKGPHRVRKIISEMNQKVKPDQSLLIVTQKQLAKVFYAHLQPHSDPQPDEDGIPTKYRLPNGATVRLGWYNRLDGLNDYQYCEHVLIFGLMYMDHVWAANMYFAIRGWDERTLPEFVGASSLRQQLEHGAMALSVIQATNRGCCRRVDDVYGNCPHMDLWIVLPNLTEGKFIKDAITADMPGIVWRKWDYQLDTADKRLRQQYAGKDAAPHALLAYMRDTKDEANLLSSIGRELGLSPRQVRRLRETLAEQCSVKTGNLYEALSTLGVAFRDGKAGRGNGAALVKAV